LVECFIVCIDKYLPEGNKAHTCPKSVIDILCTVTVWSVTGTSWTVIGTSWTVTLLLTRDPCLGKMIDNILVNYE